ncbi:MAG: 50S ribosomal protein L31 [Candidatus Doudnabacteria bacterium]|nr:50S ribosomal protein L31 [Candidatus Doudnabacteria bacterium]
MKPSLHPQYYPNAKIVCACGSAFTVGSTMPEVHVEICSNCHPFYTGNQKLIDTAGVVEKFKARAAKAKARLPKKTKTAA